MKKWMFLFLAVVMFGLFSLAAQEPVNVSGDWTMTVTTQRGERQQDVNFVQEGEKLTVTMTSRMGEAKGEGTVKGSEIEWTITRSGPQGEMTITYKGKIEDQNTMSGEAQFGSFGSGTWKATRKTS